MHKHFTIEIGIDEDDTTTLAHAVLDMGDDHFDATGRAKRNPDDLCIPLIGEELALARALASIQEQIIDAAYAKIDGMTAAKT